MSLQRFGIDSEPKSLEELQTAFTRLAALVEAITKCPDLVVGKDGVRVRPQLGGFAGQPSVESVLARDQFLISGVTYSEGDGYACRVRWGYMVMRDAAGGIDADALRVIMPTIDGVPMNHPEVGTVPFSDGDSIFLKVETDARDEVKMGSEVPTPLPMVTIVAAPSAQKSTHYQPIDPENTDGVDGVYYYKIANFTIDGEDPSRVMVEQVQGDGPIRHTPNLWTIENVGAGARVLKTRDQEADTYQARSVRGNYGVKETEESGEIVLDFWGESVATGCPIYVAPSDPLEDGAAKFAGIIGTVPSTSYTEELDSICESIDDGGDPAQVTDVKVKVFAKVANLTCNGETVGEVLVPGGQGDIEICCTCEESLAP